MQQISNIQKERERQFTTDKIRKNILSLNENYDIRFACLNGNTGDIQKDSIRKGYFRVLNSYSDINEAVNTMNAGDNILIINGNYMTGKIYEKLCDCIPGMVYNLYTGRKVADIDPIPACDLDGIRNPISFMKLYNEVSESVPELKDVLMNIEIPSIDPNLDCRKWITETWTSIHEALKDIPEENRTIEGIAYTKFTI